MNTNNALILCNLNVRLYFLDEQCRIGAAETKAVAEHEVQFGRSGFCHQVEAGAMLVRVLKIDVGSHKVVLHHDDGIDNLAGTSHPALMSRHRLGTADHGPLAVEQSVQGDGLIHVALRR